MNQGIFLDEFHAQFLSNKNIETLKIIGSPQLTAIGQSALSHYRSLQTLDLSYNSITFQSQTETYAFYHTNLIEINLSHNNIGTTDILMKAFEQTRNLRSLYLNNNRNLNFGLNGFPANLGRLEFLDLSYCHIWSLNDNVFNHLVNLKNLHLEGNALSFIPKSLCIRPPTLQIYLAKTHIEKSHQKYLQENCTIKTLFELSMPSEKSFRIVDDDRWNLSVWFYLLILSSILNVGLFIYALFVAKKKIFKERLNCF
uniref:Uncharacterized protein n=1 Tax=Panagrolaimus davidi TaxID=227884 RepID=A0A914QSH8_9BILA